MTDLVSEMKERLNIEERCRITPAESLALQAVADDLTVSKSSLMRLGIQIVLERHHHMSGMDKLSAIAGFRDTSDMG